MNSEKNKHLGNCVSVQCSHAKSASPATRGPSLHWVVGGTLLLLGVVQKESGRAGVRPEKPTLGNKAKVFGGKNQQSTGETIKFRIKFT